MIPLPSGAATHANFDATMANATAATSWKFGTTFSFPCPAMNVAAVFVAKSEYTDGQCEALTSWSAIRAAAPEESWRLDTTASIVGTGSSTQSAITGTSYTTDEPAGFWGTPDLIMPSS
jgi:hypothetical protein